MQPTLAPHIRAPTKTILFGVGQVATTLHYYLKRDPHFEVVAFTVDRAFMREQTLAGVPVVPWDSVSAAYPPGEYSMMIAVGFVRANRLRAERVAEAKALGYRLLSYVSPTALLWDGFELGENCRFGDNVMIQPFSSIGDNVFIGGGSIVGHHTMIHANCHLSSSVRLAGSVTVESFCYIGCNATIRDGVRIARSSVIGAGAVILGDTVPNGVYMAKAADLLPITSERLFSA